MTDNTQAPRSPETLRWRPLVSTSLAEALRAGEAIVAYSVPPKDDLSQSWGLRLHFLNGDTFALFTEMVHLEGWQEAGCLVVAQLGHAGGESSHSRRTEIAPFRIANANVLVVEDAGLHIESGLVLLSKEGHHLSVVAGVSPGSVTVRAPFWGGLTQPEYDWASYTMTPLRQWAEAGD